MCVLDELFSSANVPFWHKRTIPSKKKKEKKKNEIKGAAINQVKGLCLVMLPKFCLALACSDTLDLPIDSLYEV